MQRSPNVLNLAISNKTRSYKRKLRFKELSNNISTDIQRDISLIQSAHRNGDNNHEIYVKFRILKNIIYVVLCVALPS